MSKPKKSKKKITHATYNKKAFLAENSVRSMAAIHTKILDDGTAILRISDCNQSIRIWNDFNNNVERKEMIEKIESLQSHLELFKQEIQSRI